MRILKHFMRDRASPKARRWFSVGGQVGGWMALLLLADGCAHGGPQPPEAALDDETTREIDALALALEANLRGWLEAEQAALLTQTKTQLHTRADAARDPHRWVLRHYEGRQSLLFFAQGRWSACAEAVSSLLTHAQGQALRHDPILDMSLLDDARATLEQPWREQPQNLSSAQRAWIGDQYRAAAEAGARLSAQDLRTRLFADVVLWTDWLTPIAERRRQVELAANAEAELALALADYAFEMRLGYVSNSAAYALLRHSVQPSWMVDARLAAFFDDVEAHRDAEVSTQIEGMTFHLAPPHPQYALLVEARRRYEALVLEGGWNTTLEVPPEQLKFGKRLPAILEIKRRLAVEGYLDAAQVDDVWDKTLSNALLRYQKTHQLREDGLPTFAVVNNLSLPVEDRLAKIDVTLQHYRETLIGAFPYYVFVNIPDFHAEVWKDGQLTRRHRIAVGNNGRVRKRYVDPATVDPDDEEALYAFPNRTPLQFSFMKRIIYNPFWNVPERILVNEIAPKRDRNPAWYASNGFEEITTSNGSKITRQRPGPNNALGQVKFVFPNPHNTYLHDTNAPWVFKLPTRALSHGCMRVQNPLVLAEYLLRQDDQFDAREVKELLERSTLQTIYHLNRPVPVHVDYLITRVDEEGFVHFLSDIYRRDRRAIEARTNWILTHLRADQGAVSRVFGPQ